MLVAVLIGIIISIVVGVNLIPMITKSIEEAAPEGEEPSAAVSTILDILPIVFVVVLILGAVAWIGGFYGSSSVTESKSKDYDFGGGKMSGKELLERIEREEEVPYGQEVAFHEEEGEGEQAEDEEGEVLESPRAPFYEKYHTREVLGIPKAPPSKGKPQGKPPWAI